MCVTGRPKAVLVLFALTAGEIEKQMEVIDDRELGAYIGSLGARLAAQPQA